jgi:DNA polymerase-3 subunit delta
MKLEPRRVAGFLRDPGTCRAVLLYGEDAGLIHTRADLLTRAVLGEADDPFRLAWLAREEIGRLPAEASAMSLTGGRRVVRVRDAADLMLPALEAALPRAGDTLIILEAPDLGARSKLRTYLERVPEGAAIGCYAEEGAALDGTIKAALAADRLSVDPDAMQFLRAHLGADQAATQAELEKLVLYVGEGGRVDLAAAQDCVGDVAAISADEALFAATAGDRAGMDRALGVALAEGAAAVSVLRQATGHLQRLHRARLVMQATGADAAEAVRQVRPPVFFKRTRAFAAALSVWPAAALLRAAEAVAAAERECKRTGAPDVLLCQRALAGVAEQAAVLRRRGAR